MTDPRTPSEALRWLWWRICEQHNARKTRPLRTTVNDDVQERTKLNSWAWNAMLDIGVMAEADRLESAWPPKLSEEDAKLVVATFSVCMDRLVAGYRGTTVQRVESALEILAKNGIVAVRIGDKE